MRQQMHVQSTQWQDLSIDGKAAGDAPPAGEVYPMTVRGASVGRCPSVRPFRFRAAWAMVVALMIGLAALASPVVAATVYVSPNGADANDGMTWATAKKTVTAGLTAAVSGDQVWVAAGTYVEYITLGSGVALYGGFAGSETALSQRNWTTNVSILDGNKAGSVVTAPAGATTDTRIDGFTIRNGSGTLINSQRCGGGVIAVSASPTISNNLLKENVAAKGGGIYCEGVCSPNIIANTIVGNKGGGVYVYIHSTPAISNNAVSQNTGVGICCDNSAPTILGNTITDNSESGIYCNKSGSTPYPSIVGNKIGGNRGAGISCKYCSPTISNNVITGNASTVDTPGGGIMCIFYSSPVVSNNAIVGSGTSGIYCHDHSSPTVSSNTIVGGGCAVVCYSNSSPIVSNNIMAFNSIGIYSHQSTPVSRRNCIYNPDGDNYVGLQPGLEDILIDPRLSGAEYGQIHLAAASPCIDAGDDAAIQATWTDMDGQSRIQGLHVDIGADEFNGATPFFSPTTVRVSSSGSDGNNGSSWILAKLTVQAAIDQVERDGGGEIWVSAGAYNEPIILRPSVYLYGGFAGTENQRNERAWVKYPCVLDGNARGPVVTAMCGHRMGCIDGFTIRNGTQASGSPGGGGMFCPTSPIISHNTIKGNNAGYGGGIFCLRSQPVITNNRIMANSGGGIYCASAKPLISGNTIVGNAISGIYSDYSSGTISNNIVAFNPLGIRVASSGMAGYGDAPTSWSNCLYNPSGKDYDGLPSGVDDIFADPRMVASDFGEVHLKANSPCIDAGDDTAMKLSDTDVDGEVRIQGGHVDIGADEYDGVTPLYTPVVIRVHPSGSDANDGLSWFSAKKTVQAGINAIANCGGEVWVAEGIYVGRIRLQPWVYVYGGFAGTETDRTSRNWTSRPTVLDGGAEGSVVSVVASGRCGVDGVTIRNGTGTLWDGALLGGGVFCYGSLPTISNSIIAGNRTYSGSGLYCSYSSPSIINLAIIGNSATNTGSGLFLYNSESTVTNCTLSGNSSSSSACLANSYGRLNLTNCIFWNNGNKQISSTGAPPTITYSDIQGGWVDSGNINSNPRFVRNPNAGADNTWGTADDDYGDLRLQAGSPCVDAGNNSAVPVGTLTDLTGRARFIDDPNTPDTGAGTVPIVDMGPYEARLVPGDFNYDEVVDGRDRDMFAACLTGPAIRYAGGLPTDCSLTVLTGGLIAADFDKDGDVDQSDFGVFQECFSGSDQPGDPNCAK